MTKQQAEEKAEKMGFKDPKYKQQYIELMLSNKFDKEDPLGKISQMYRYYLRKEELVADEFVVENEGDIGPNRLFFIKQIITAGPEVEKIFLQSSWID